MTRSTNPGLFTLLKSDRTLLLFCVIALFYSIGAGAIMFILPTIASFFTSDFTLLAILLSLPSITALIAEIPAGSLSDTLGRKKVAVIGLCFIFPLMFAVPALLDLSVFIVFSLAFGFSIAMINSPSRAYVMDISKKGLSAEYFGFFLAFVSLGTAIGPLIAGVILDTGFSTGLIGIATLYVITGLIAIILFSTLKESIKTLGKVKAALRRLFFEEKIFVKTIRDYSKLKSLGVLVLFVSFLLTLVDGIIWTFEPIYYGELGLSASFGGILLFAFVVPLVLFQIPAGFAADKYGKKKLLLIGLLLSGLSMISFGLVTDALGLLLSLLFVSLGLALCWPSVGGIITEISTNQERGGISGVWNIFMDFANLIAPFVGGLIALFFVTTASIFWCAGILLIVSLIPVAILSRK